MELYQEMMIHLLAKENIQITFSKDLLLEEQLSSVCYRALCEIKEILEDTALDDRDCFLKIERIVRVFEDIGSSCGSRHDF